jgi:uncharacterized YigZ family protein
VIEEYRTVAGVFEHEGEKIKGSRFIARAAFVADAAEAEHRVADVHREYAEASHHCYAYRLDPESDAFRTNDAGEPGGSAGRPILQQIESHGLHHTLVVVTRYFGGVKLGVGGLIRAYGGAANEVLSRAPTRVVRVTRRLSVSFPYEVSGAVQGALAAAGLVPVASDYGEAVSLTLDVPVGAVARVTEELRDRTSGVAQVREIG